MIINRYKNGNFTAKMEESDYNRESTLINLIWGLYDADCELFGDEYCISNWEMAVDMYCYYTDRLIRIPYSILEDLENGRTVRLYARKLDEYDRAELAEMEESA
jgi:hypothetical protein